MDSVTSKESGTNAGGIQTIYLTMCKNFLPYNLTRLPNRFGHMTQMEINRHIEPLWTYIDYGCSNNFRLFVCSTFLPKYDLQTRKSSSPCKEMCQKARQRCKPAFKQTNSKWPRSLKCNKLPRQRGGETCIEPVTESRGQLQHTYCARNLVPQCKGLPYAFVSLPNSFLQINLFEISIELANYEKLIATGCSRHLTFLLCGTYLPFCVHRESSPYTMPCQELCDSVKADCKDSYSRTYPGLPWPSKLQCNRYPLEDSDKPCAMPGSL